MAVWLNGRVLAAAFVALVIGISGGAAVAVASKQTQVDDVRSSLAASRDEVADLQDGLNEANDQLADSEAEAENLADRNLELAGNLGQIKAELREMRARRPMPDLIGEQREAAVDITSGFDWDVSISKEQSEEPVGTVLAQTPTVGATMRSGSPVTLTIAEPIPPGWKDVKVFTGAGELNTDPFKISGKARLVYEFSGDTNAAMTLYRVPHRYTDLLLNEIGSRSGTTRLYYSGTFWLEICCGTYTVRVQEWR